MEIISKINILHENNHLSQWSIHDNIDSSTLSGITQDNIKLSRIIFTNYNNSILTKVIFYDNNKKLITSSFDCNIRIWNVETNQMLMLMEGHTNIVSDMILLSNDKLASCSIDKTIRIWKLNHNHDHQNQEYKCISILIDHTHFVYCLLQLTNSILISGSYDRSLKLWNINNIEDDDNTFIKLKNSYKTFNFQNQKVTRCIIHIDENNLGISSDEDINIYNYDHNKYHLKCLKVLRGHTKTVRDMKIIDYQNKVLMSGSNDGHIRLWNLKNGTCIKNYIGHTSWIYSLLILSNKIFVTASNDLKLWNIHTGICFKTIENNNGKRLQSICSLIKLSKNSFAFIDSSENVEIFTF